MKTSQEISRGPGTVRLKIAVRGLVQGVGFRPFAYRLARELDLKGWVSNDASGVLIEAEGLPADVDIFLTRLRDEKPERSSIQSLEAAYLDPRGYGPFEIRESGAAGLKSALVMPDIATCSECRMEIFDPRNRRYRYPFTNCTHCGPRYSILEALPYDRCRTTMKKFSMCKVCDGEYRDPADRRFHAQPNACPDCGPVLELWDREGRIMAVRDKALRLAVLAIQRGKIVAIKGLGGFHLLADARNAEAVTRLRERKHREEKPFALMVPDLAAAKKYCRVSPAEERLLVSPEAPIVLLNRQKDCAEIADAVAPKNPYLGVMLPYTPLHHLLLSDLAAPVIATSGNLSDEPIVTDEYEALNALGGTADYFLVHNRPIARFLDDSVTRVMLGRPLMLRRARGYAPLPVAMIAAHETSILAAGAHLKNSIAQSVGGQVFISQHIGDLETEKTFNVFKSTIHTFKKLYGRMPDLMASDLHPDYLSTRYAKQSHLPVIGVQHHYAHILSCMAENELEGPVLGVSWDGTGLGDDGTLWGGEFLWVDPKGYARAGQLRPFRLPGAEKAVSQPRRSALGLLYEIFGDGVFDMKLPVLDYFTAEELRVLRVMLRQNLQCPVTSSAGRLFDAVAALLGLRPVHRFEAQAAMELEFLAEGQSTRARYPFEVSERLTQSPGSYEKFGCHNALRVFDWEALVRGVLGDVQKGVPAGEISAKFHNTLAEMIVQAALFAGEPRVVLTGGCFQNKLLLERSVERLTEMGFAVYWHQRVPPNDGGIALGQVIGAMRTLKPLSLPREELICV